MMDRSPHCDVDALKLRLRERARQLGAGSVRVTAAHADETTQERLNESFARGDLATWPYDAAHAQRAASPQALLEGAQSIVCIAFPYATPAPPERPLHGRVSNYAWSRDYHPRLRAALREIAALVDEAAGAPVTAIACDTKPLAERAFAARSGLGWIGKHTNLIDPQHGSFVFLGEIVTTLALPPDTPLRKTCGACARCIPACPTGALRGDYTIDATRCISDLTQRTDGIPRALRPLVGTWVWGCDLCQLACPPNHRAQPPRDTHPHEPASHDAAAPALFELLRLRSGDFKRRYAPTAMGWRGAAVLRRNAAVALGNTLDRAAIPALARALREDPHPMVRGHAAWALGRIGAPAALDALHARLHSEPASGAREEIACALEPFGPGPPLHSVYEAVGS